MSRRIGHDYKGFPDGLHPDDEGNRRLAGILADTTLHGRPQAHDAWSFSFKGTTPVSIITPPVFQPDATVDVEMTVSGRKDTVSVRADGEGRLALTTAPHDCRIRFPTTAAQAR